MAIPKITIEVNWRGLANMLQRTGMEKVSPTDYFEIINTARNPRSGEYYWNAVNYGRPAVTASIDVSMRIKGGRTQSIVNKKRLSFYHDGAVVSPSYVGPTKPVHMRERVMPQISSSFKKFYAAFIREHTFTFPEVTEWREFTYFAGGKEHTGIGEHLVTPARTVPITMIGIGSTIGSALKFIMEQTLNYAVKQLADITPVIQPEYYSEGYTPEPGLLKTSYVWRPRGSRSNRDDNMLSVETNIYIHERARQALKLIYGTKTKSGHQTEIAKDSPAYKNYQKLTRKLDRLINYRNGIVVRREDRNNTKSLGRTAKPHGKSTKDKSPEHILTGRQQKFRDKFPPPAVDHVGRRSPGGIHYRHIGRFISSLK